VWNDDGDPTITNIFSFSLPSVQLLNSGTNILYRKFVLIWVCNRQLIQLTIHQRDKKKIEEKKHMVAKKNKMTNPNQYKKVWQSPPF
jgi:hypothetical protein